MAALYGGDDSEMTQVRSAGRCVSVFVSLHFSLQTRVMGQDPGFLCGLEQGGAFCYRARHP